MAAVGVVAGTARDTDPGNHIPLLVIALYAAGSVAKEGKSLRVHIIRIYELVAAVPVTLPGFSPYCCIDCSV